MSHISGLLTTITMPTVTLTNVFKEKVQKGGADTTNIFSLDYIFANIITIALMILAGYLCWQCNIKTDMVLRVIYTCFAIFFNWLYLIYYFIYRVVFHNVCSS